MTTGLQPGEGLGALSSRRGPASWREHITPWMLLAPALLVVLALRVIPLITAFALSFTDTDLSRAADTPSQGVWLDNYATVLASSDFWHALATTVAIIGPALVLEMSLGLLVALWLHSRRRLMGLLRGITILPYLLVPVVVGNFFRMFYNAQFGQLNYFLGIIGVSDQAWLTNPSLVRWSVVAMEVWHTTPFVVLLVLAGLAGMPRDPVDAAMVDGAGSIQRFRYVVLPELLPILLAVFALRAMDAVQLFDEVYVLTGGGPGRLTAVFNMYLYQFGFRQFDIGHTSAAVSIIVLFLTVVAIVVRTVRRRTEESRRPGERIAA